MLNDLDPGKQYLEHIHQAWMKTLDVIEDPIFVHDAQFRILRCNKAYKQRAGIPFDQIIGRPYYTIFPKTPGPLPGCLSATEEAETEISIGNCIYRSRAFPIHDEQGAYLHSVHTLEDITTRKQAETELQHANRALSTLSRANRSLVRTDNEDDLLQAICESIVEQQNYAFAWCGYVQHDENRSIKIMHQAGDGQGLLNAIPLTWADSADGITQSGRAIRTRSTQLCQDIAHPPVCSLWQDEEIKRGFASSIALPLAENGNEMFGVLTVYSKETHAFSAFEISLLEEMAGDLAFGIRALRIRAERDRALEEGKKRLVQLEASLEDTVRAISTIVEMRDPYTAGHQANVAHLAAAIAQHMGLPEERIHSLRLAGTVHDIGKIKIPSEILSKPGKLDELEFGIIKTHPQAGYNILKDINFPWPIATMVLQHHERLDGSGYPQGLKNDKIILEAKILCVADVVDAITSHRPYRPGRGLEAALSEIKSQRGILYDAAVVDACLSAFKEQSFHLKKLPYSTDRLYD